jgi:hypothetical protein
MNGVNLLEENDFWKFIAENNSYIQHHPTAKPGKDFRYSRFNDEGTIGELTKLGWPRLELRDAPGGRLGAQGEWVYDDMMREFRIINKVPVNDFDAKLQSQSDAKDAALQIIGYIKEAQESGDTCGTIIKSLDVRSFSYEILEYATADASFAGVLCRIRFRAGIDWEDASYGPLPPYGAQSGTSFWKSFLTVAGQVDYLLPEFYNATIKFVQHGNMPLVPGQFAPAVNVGSNGRFRFLNPPFPIEDGEYVNVCYTK